MFVSATVIETITLAFYRVTLRTGSSVIDEIPTEFASNLEAAMDRDPLVVTYVRIQD